MDLIALIRNFAMHYDQQPYEIRVDVFNLEAVETPQDYARKWIAK